MRGLSYDTFRHVTLQTVSSCDLCSHDIRIVIVCVYMYKHRDRDKEREREIQKRVILKYAL